MRRVIAVGHAALDQVYRIAEFPAKPTKVRALEHIEAGGGMAANAAAAVGRLGGRVELWSRVGADEEGRRITAFLQMAGVDTGYVKVFPGRRSSTAAIIVDGRGERLIVGERDHAMSLDASWLPLERVNGAGVVLSDLRWFEGTLAAFQEARSRNVTTMLDVDLGGGEILGEFLRLTDYAIFSAPALDQVLPLGSQESKLEKVRALGPCHAGVTLGEKGYAWIGRDGMLRHRPALAVEVVDTTGAGDAFHGAFAWAIAEGRAEEDCVKVAIAAAALKCRRLGARAGLPTRVELDAALQQERELLLRAGA